MADAVSAAAPHDWSGHGATGWSDVNVQRDVT